MQLRRGTLGRLIRRGLLLVVALGAAACGGSASERSDEVRTVTIDPPQLHVGAIAAQPDGEGVLVEVSQTGTCMERLKVRLVDGALEVAGFGEAQLCSTPQSLVSVIALLAVPLEPRSLPRRVSYDGKVVARCVAGDNAASGPCAQLAELFERDVVTQTSAADDGWYESEPLAAPA